MLSHLSIKDYALIDELDEEFPSGFITLTGETGAGKSIILGALGLLCGNRPDAKAIRQGAKKAVIEAVFTNPPAELKEILAQADAEWDDSEIIIRKEVAASGRHRNFVNDTPVSLTVLSQISPLLIDIHSQHNNLLLTNSSYQRFVLDRYGDYGDMLSSYRSLFAEFMDVHEQLKELKRIREKARTDLHLITGQLELLDALNLKEGEYAQVDADYNMLTNAAELREALYSAFARVDGDDDNAIAMINQAVNLLANVDFSVFRKTSDEDSPAERLRQIEIELKDISFTLSQYISKAEANPHRLAALESRLAQILSTAKKFGCADPEELVGIHENLRQRMELLSDSTPEIKELELKEKYLADTLRKAADQISRRRKATAETLEDNIKAAAMTLGLPNLQFKIDVAKAKIGSEGQDAITFTCAFNKNQTLLPLNKVASGGEIARLMLTIKGIIASKMQLPTMIFDEIDTGVSGEIASKMGSMMRSMARDMQIITVTHLPQVAAKGTSQYHVYKQDDETSTTTHITKLNDQQRVMEIAGLLSGDKLTEAAIANARTLLT